MHLYHKRNDPVLVYDVPALQKLRATPSMAKTLVVNSGK
jgi:hypothetical protein